jgi:hypothetical protein
LTSVHTDCVFVDMIMMMYADRVWHWFQSRHSGQDWSGTQGLPVFSGQELVHK